MYVVAHVKKENNLGRTYKVRVVTVEDRITERQTWTWMVVKRFNVVFRCLLLSLFCSSKAQIHCAGNHINHIAHSRAIQSI